MAAHRKLVTPAISYKRDWYAKNKEELNRKHRNWYDKNKEKMQSLSRVRYKKSSILKIYSSKKQKENYERNKNWLLKNKDIKCERCGYKEFFCSIDGHHLNPSQKRNKYDLLSKWLKRLSLNSFIKKINEIDIMFLCRNCHSGLSCGDWKLKD